MIFLRKIAFNFNKKFRNIERVRVIQPLFPITSPTGVKSPVVETQTQPNFGVLVTHFPSTQETSQLTVPSPETNLPSHRSITSTSGVCSEEDVELELNGQLSLGSILSTDRSSGERIDRERERDRETEDRAPVPMPRLTPPLLPRRSPDFNKNARNHRPPLPSGSPTFEEINQNLSSSYDHPPDSTSIKYSLKERVSRDSQEIGKITLAAKPSFGELSDKLEQMTESGKEELIVPPKTYSKPLPTIPRPITSNLQSSIQNLNKKSNIKHDFKNKLNSFENNTASNFESMNLKQPTAVQQLITQVENGNHSHKLSNSKPVKNDLLGQVNAIAGNSNNRLRKRNSSDSSSSDQQKVNPFLEMQRTKAVTQMNCMSLERRLQQDAITGRPKTPPTMKPNSIEDKENQENKDRRGRTSTNNERSSSLETSDKPLYRSYTGLRNTSLKRLVSTEEAQAQGILDPSTCSQPVLANKTSSMNAKESYIDFCKRNTTNKDNYSRLASQKKTNMMNKYGGFLGVIHGKTTSPETDRKQRVGSGRPGSIKDNVKNKFMPQGVGLIPSKFNNNKSAAATTAAPNLPPKLSPKSIRNKNISNKSSKSINTAALPLSENELTAILTSGESEIGASQLLSDDLTSIASFNTRQSKFLEPVVPTDKDTSLYRESRKKQKKSKKDRESEKSIKNKSKSLSRLGNEVKLRNNKPATSALIMTGGAKSQQTRPVLRPLSVSNPRNGYRNPMDNLKANYLDAVKIKVRIILSKDTAVDGTPLKWS